MSDNGPQNQRNALRITFGGPSDSTGSNQNGGARSKQRRPQGLPNNTASWFTALTQHCQKASTQKGAEAAVKPLLVPHHVVATVQEIQLQAAVNELLLLEWLAMAVMLLLLCCCLTD